MRSGILPRSNRPSMQRMAYLVDWKIRLLLAPRDHVYIEGGLDLIHAHRRNHGVGGQHSEQGQVVLSQLLLKLGLEEATLPCRHLQAVTSSPWLDTAENISRLTLTLRETSDPC